MPLFNFTFSMIIYIYIKIGCYLISNILLFSVCKVSLFTEIRIYMDYGFYYHYYGFTVYPIKRHCFRIEWLSICILYIVVF